MKNDCTQRRKGAKLGGYSLRLCAFACNIQQRLSLLLLFLLLSFSSKANFDFNANCIRAYKEIIGLRLSSARALIAAEKREHPKNSVTFLLDNYADYFTVVLSENKSDFEKLKNNKSARLDRISKDDKNSPWYLFAQAEIHLQSALTRAVFQEYFSSSLDINKAYKLLEDNSKKFPAFLPNQKGLGVVNAVLGSMPESFRKMMSLVGIKGNAQTGVRMLEKLTATLPGSGYSYFYDEAVSCLSFVQIVVLGNQAAYPQLFSLAQKMDTLSLLRSYVLAYAAIRTAHTNDVLAALNNRPRGEAYQSFPYLDYMAGTAYLHKLDFAASRHFEAYLQNYKGVHFIKDTYLNLAWIALLKGNITGYKEYANLVKLKGHTNIERDKQALMEANDPVPDPDLLKARLLFDGGYYDRALAEISNKKLESFTILRDKIEYNYRMGRIYDETGKDELAIKYYQAAITLGRKERYYFASNAALRTGIIYEKRKDLKRARLFYTTALNMDDHDYEKSIENKAKDGLKRTED